MVKFGNPNKVIAEPGEEKPDVLRLVDPRSENRHARKFDGVCVRDQEDERVNCKIVDISNSGAKLEFASTEPIPDMFKVYVAALKIVLSCRVAWRTPKQLGVKHVPNWIS